MSGHIGMRTLQGDLFSTLILGSVFGDNVIFYGIIIIKLRRSIVADCWYWSSSVVVLSVCLSVDLFLGNDREFWKNG